MNTRKCDTCVFCEEDENDKTTVCFDCIGLSSKPNWKRQWKLPGANVPPPPGSSETFEEEQERRLQGLRRKNSKQNIKTDAGKPKLRLVWGHFPKAMFGACAVREFSASKGRPDDSWKEVELERWLDSLGRHLIAIMNGETHDPESGKPHVDHIACNGLIISQKWHDEND